MNTMLTAALVLAEKVAFGYSLFELFIGAIIIIAIVLIAFKLLSYLK